jgi:hypothetical protein
MTCLFCNKSDGITSTGSAVTCTSCDKVAIAKERLAANKYEDGNRGAWLRALDEKAARGEL